MAAEKNFENKVKKFLKDKGAWVLKYWGSKIRKLCLTVAMRKM